MQLQHLLDIGLPLQRAPSSQAPPAPSPRPAAARAAAAGTPAADAAAGAASRPACLVLPRGTPLDGEPACLSVVSYNLLAPAFVRPLDARTGEVQPFAAFPWAEPAGEVLDWEARRPRLLAELRACRADVICLQEVQFEHGEAGEHVLPGWLALDGYGARLPMQSSLQQMAERNGRVLGNDVAIGTALLYRKDRLELAEDGPSRDPNVRVMACLRGRPGSALGSVLGPTAVVSVHLDAQSEEKRVERLRTCLSKARHWGVRDMVIAGDMNTECLPGSCAAALIADAPEPTAAELARECASALRLGGDEAEGDEAPAAPAAAAGSPTEAQLEDYAALWRRAAALPGDHRMALSRVPTGATRAGYDHGKFCGPCVSWRLDHILYTHRTLALRSAWAALEADPEALASGLPNRACPSDHLPVAAVFAPSPAPCLDGAGRVELLRRLDGLEARQAAEAEALKARVEQMTVPQPAAPAAEPPAHDAAAGGKKAKKKAERPSPEMQALIQERRRLLREQKAQHAQERASLVAALGELERDAVDGMFDADLWAESGDRKRGPSL